MVGCTQSNFWGLYYEPSEDEARNMFPISHDYPTNISVFIGKEKEIILYHLQAVELLSENKEHVCLRFCCNVISSLQTESWCIVQKENTFHRGPNTT